MDRALVIYDKEGTIIAIYHGADNDHVPKGVPYMWVDFPANAMLDHIDMTTGRPVWNYLPETELGQLQVAMTEIQGAVSSMEGTVASLDTASTAQATDIETTQLAIAELYELIIGGVE